MTEAEWLACVKPTRMVQLLRGKASYRKVRLYACACCRRVQHLLTKKRSRALLELAERAADEGIDQRKIPEIAATHGPWIGGLDSFFAHSSALHAAYQPQPGRSDQENRDTFWLIVATASPDAAANAESKSRTLGKRKKAVLQVHSSILRDIFGNPFRPVSLDPAWLTSTVIALARGIYDGRAFDRLPILADALEDAGCDNRDILDHCHGDGPHVRGCWVVDLVLCKS